MLRQLGKGKLQTWVCQNWCINKKKLQTSQFSKRSLQILCPPVNQEFTVLMALQYISGSQTVGRNGLERGAQHTFLQTKIKTALNQLD
jgi:hypothetical protein